MEVQDGFILGIYNYCDRWCEYCRFTSRCRLFADQAMHEATAAGDLKDVAEAPQHPSDYRQPSKWLEEALADFDESKIPELPPPPPLPVRHAAAVPVKLLLCLGTVARDGPGPQKSDANGWGKAALLGLERMRAAWRLLVDTHHCSESDVAPFLSEISRMQRNLERAVPHARLFVRPGLDEPDEVKMLDAREC